MGACVAHTPPAYLKSTLHPAIFLEMVKFVVFGVLYFSLVLPGQATTAWPRPSVEFKVLGRPRLREIETTVFETSQTVSREDDGLYCDVVVYTQSEFLF